MRAALYFTPPRDHPLAVAAAEWLGRDAFAGAPFPPVKLDGIDAGDAAGITAEPRRYGFHATLKAPFRLREGRSLDDLDEAVAGFCRGRPPVPIGRLVVGELERFVALIPEEAPRALTALAGEVVTTFDGFRAPLGEAELARRRAAPLTAEQDANLLRWGYPYVLDQFRFHMTLTGPLDEATRPAVINLLRTRFSGLVSEPLTLDGLAIFVEAEPGADFVVHSRHDFALHRIP